MVPDFMSELWGNHIVIIITTISLSCSFIFEESLVLISREFKVRYSGVQTSGLNLSLFRRAGTG
jgi:hypothetical protein